MDGRLCERPWRLPIIAKDSLTPLVLSRAEGMLVLVVPPDTTASLWCCTQGTPGVAGLVCAEGSDPASTSLKSLSHSPISLYLSCDTCRQLQGAAKSNLLARKILSSVQESTTAPHQRNVNRE